jgi:hypothetical protein
MFTTEKGGLHETGRNQRNGKAAQYQGWKVEKG